MAGQIEYSVSIFIQSAKCVEVSLAVSTAKRQRLGSDGSELSPFFLVRSSFQRPINGAFFMKVIAVKTTKREPYFL
ncbi:hypothetical protein D3C71_1786990 [compost metagenome]